MVDGVAAHTLLSNLMLFITNHDRFVTNVIIAFHGNNFISIDLLIQGFLEVLFLFVA